MLATHKVMNYFRQFGILEYVFRYCDFVNDTYCTFTEYYTGLFCNDKTFEMALFVFVVMI